MSVNCKLANSISTKYVLTFCLKIFSFIVGIDDTGDSTLLAEISATFCKNLRKNCSNRLFRGMRETDS